MAGNGEILGIFSRKSQQNYLRGWVLGMKENDSKVD